MSDKNIDICNEVELGNTIEDNAISLLADSGKCSDSEARGRIRLLLRITQEKTHLHYCFGAGEPHV